MDEMTWDDFAGRLASFLATMTAPGQQDHLVLNAPAGDPSVEGCAPYAQIAGFDDGEMLRVELTGNQYLAAAYRLDDERCAAMADEGWSGHDADGEPNHYQELPIDSVRTAADLVVAAFRDDFGIPAPGLLTVDAWGPAATGADALGLVPAGEVVVEKPPAVGFPDDGAQLTSWVRATLCERLGPQPTTDDDGDFVLTHLDQPVWVRVHDGTPTVQIMARVAHDVRSRRQSAVEIGLLNRDHDWVKWTLRDHAVWQSLLVAGNPFSPALLNSMLTIFFETMSMTRDDLVMRTSGRVA